MKVRKYFWIIFIFSLFISPDIPAQEEIIETESGQTEPAAPATAQRIEAELPRENTNIIFIEGEDAVSTNFNKEPILNYGCSGKRTLQLNRSRERQGGAVNYANYVFYVTEPGTYELWYGGTPPGPADDLYPSFSSPFSYTLDNREAETLYREDIAVVEEYAPSYFWCLAGDIEMESGEHTMAFEVSERRRYDSRYYFYLDAFFLVRKEGNMRITGADLPSHFPKDMENRTIDYPFRTIEDYQIIIRDNPKEIRAYIELSSIYTLVGDYLNALKYLKRAALIEPENTEVLLLIAKNRIWKGDLTEGLKNYRELLLKIPRTLAIWGEAGKIAAWTGRYEESISFFENGLTQFSGNLSLVINLGLTHLWAGEAKKAQMFFQQAEESAADQYPLLMELAAVYLVNGYPEKAIELYEKITAAFPKKIEAYLLLETQYIATGKKQQAENTGGRIRDTFVATEALGRYLDLFHKKQGLKDELIGKYEARLLEEPDNLDLRETLAQTYFWNGDRQKGIEEYLNIIINHAFAAFKNLDRESVDLLQLIDRGYLYYNYFQELPLLIRNKSKEITSQRGAFNSAQKAYQSFMDRVRAVKEKGAEPPQPAGKDPQDTLKAEEEKLSRLLSEAIYMLNHFSESESSYAVQQKKIEQIKSDDHEQKELFHNLTRAIRWEWNRRDFIAELQRASEKKLSLARYILAKIQLIEGKPEDAEKLFSTTDETEAGVPFSSYGVIESLLRQGKIEEALANIEAADQQTSDLYPQLESVVQFAADIQLVDLSTAGSDLYSGFDQIENLLKELKELEKEAPEQQKIVEKDLQSLHTLLNEKMVRSIYYFQEATFNLRNELGDFYLQEQELESAIRQFREVLAIDPWDISAVSRLGQVYEWHGNWSQALKNYKRVYYADPLYENITHRYNNLARKYADSHAFSGYGLADTTRLTYHSEASFVNLLDSIWSYKLKIKTDTVRIFKPTAPLDPSTHLMSELSLSVPINLYFWKLEVAPLAGACFLNNLYSKDTAAAISGDVTVADFFTFNQVEPHLGLELKLNPNSYLFFTGAYSFERQPETIAPQRPRILSHSGDLDITTMLAFIKHPLFRDSSLRTYARIESLTDSNLLTTFSQSFYLGLLDLEKPAINLKLSGNVLYQDSSFDEELYYYSPQQVILATGGLLLSSYHPLNEENALGLSFRAAGGSYMEELSSATEIRKRIQMDLEANINYYRGESAYNLGAAFSTTYRYYPENLPESQWDYWSLVIRVGYSAKLPRLLAP